VLVRCSESGMRNEVDGPFSAACRYLLGQPPRRSQQPRITIAGTYQLDAERHAGAALQQWQAHRGHAAKCPERAEQWIAGVGKTFRRGARRGGSENRVIALFEKLEETFMDQVDSPKRGEVIRRAHFASSLNLCPQLLR
jgi:hypothetical protein